jgi:hypothetical protein
MESGTSPVPLIVLLQARRSKQGEVAPRNVGWSDLIQAAARQVAYLIEL